MNVSLKVMVSAATVLFAASAHAQMPRQGAADDPSHSGLVALLQRPEVQQELHLDIRQKNALMEIQAQGQADLRQRIQQALTDRSGLPDFQNMTDEQKRQLGERMQQQMQAALRAAQSDLDDKSLAALRPPQVKRLHELDLQRRGPLAIVDGKVADRLQIDPEHRTDIIRIFGEYREKLQTENQRLFQNFRAPGATDQGPEALKSAMIAMDKRQKELKKEAEVRALAALSAEEKQRWNTAMGEKFTFKPDPVVPLPGMGRAGPGGG